MPNVDFARMKMVHSTWGMKLRGFVFGREGADPQDLMSPHECDLGKWIYSGGMSKYGHLSAMQELEKAHASMHSLVKRVVELKSAGKTQAAEQEFLKIYEASKQVVALISAVEKDAG